MVTESFVKPENRMKDGSNRISLDGCFLSHPFAR